MNGHRTILYIAALLICWGCSSNSKRQQRVEEVPVSTSDVYGPYKSAGSVAPATESAKEAPMAAGHRDIPPATLDSYEEGLTDGEAAAEEDRLAGRPGMQLGEDDDLEDSESDFFDDEDDYDEGYDDGYDE